MPFGVDMYIYPVVWGGIGAAVAAAGIGPFVSLLKGWYMSFWPVLSLAILMVSSVAGDFITIFSQPLLALNAPLPACGRRCDCRTGVRPKSQLLEITTAHTEFGAAVTVRSRSDK